MSASRTMPGRRRVPADGDYGYCNARIRGMKSRLLDRGHLEDCLSAPDLRGVVLALAASEYAFEFDEARLHGLDAETADLALKANMVRTFRKVLGLLNEEGFELITALLGRWDVFNIKTVIRAKQLGLSFEETQSGLVPVGSLGLVELKELSAARDVRGVVDTIVTWGLPIAGALRDGHAEYSESGDLAELELALDRYYAGWSRERLAGRGANARVARHVMETHTDILNLMTVFRLQKADVKGVDHLRFHLPGGAVVTERLFEELVKVSEVDEVIDRLRTTRYRSVLEDVAMLYVETSLITVFERALEGMLVRRILEVATKDPLGVGVAIGYLWAKQNEVTNVRIIVKGVSVGMPVERVRRELIFV